MKNVENIVFKLIDDKIKTADVYHNGGSLWLIFTEEKKWMIEFTSEGILWYNFQFFNTILTMVGLIEQRTEIVKKWFESRFLNKPKVENTIQNGVKHTTYGMNKSLNKVENTIQNGVKHTLEEIYCQLPNVEDTIQNGVKLTTQHKIIIPFAVEDTIKNGVKDITYRRFVTVDVEDTIKNGVKHTVNRCRH